MNVRELLRLLIQPKLDMESEVILSINQDDGTHQLIEIVAGKSSIAGSTLFLSGKEELKIGQ
jgi:hypothetical protein